MMRGLRFFSVTVFSVAMLAGCGSKINSPIVGNWAANCDASSGTGQQSILSFDGSGTANFGTIAYGDTVCSQPQMKIQIPGTYSVSGNNLTINISSNVTYTMLNQAYVDSANQQSYLGISNWQLNVAQTVSQNSAQSQGVSTVIPLGSSSATEQFSVSGNTVNRKNNHPIPDWV